MVLTQSHLFTFLMIIFKECCAAHHWIVTENGRIEVQMDSAFNMKQPHDLVGLMQQEKRVIMIEKLRKQLIAQKEEIDRKEDKETNLEAKIYATDEDCIAAGKPLTEFDLYTTTVTPLPDISQLSEDFLEAASKMDPNIEYNRPNCKEVIDLDFSMHTFEHLAGVRDRENLVMSSETDLHHAVTTLENIELYGHLVNEFLHKNKTSWVLFDMAGYFWRIQGNSLKAIECVRRALHYAPRQYKYISLINLGNILHQSHVSEDAAIVVHAAIDIAPNNAMLYFALGNIYAVLADYNKSAICFENVLRLNPSFVNAVLLHHAVLCHKNLEKALEDQHLSLQRTLNELREYQQQHENWLKEHEKMLNQQASPEEKLEQRLAYEEQKFLRDPNARDQECFQFEQNGHVMLSCNMRRDTYTIAQSQMDMNLNLQLLQALESRAGKVVHKMGTKQGSYCPGR